MFHLEPTPISLKVISIFTCEATAILKALEIIKMNMNKCIYSDSKSCLIAIGNLNK